jgi:hypothetical protein
MLVLYINILHCSNILETEMVYILRECRRRAQCSDFNLKVSYLNMTAGKNFTFIAVWEPARCLSVANCSVRLCVHIWNNPFSSNSLITAHLKAVLVTQHSSDPCVIDNITSRGIQYSVERPSPSE